MKTNLPLLCMLFSFLLTSQLFAQLTPTYNDVMIPMSDLKELEADVYIPSGCVECEVILVQTPYNKDLFEWGLPMGIGMNLNDQPFIWVIVDWRGFYGSAAAAVSNPDRGQDGYDICEWIVDQSWHANRIGTWGPSALGNIQYQLIDKEHPNHTCAVPIVANPQFAYSAYFYGGVLEEARLEQLDVLGYGLTPVVMANVYYSPVWQYAESTTYYPDDIMIPTLQIGGWYDHNIDEMMTFYQNSRNQAGVAVQDEQWLLVGPWVHGGTGIAYVGSETQGELSYPNAAHMNDSMAWDFFNYYLLDSANNWMTTPKITYYELGTNQWLTSNDDHLDGNSSSTLYLNSANRLTAEIGNGSSAFLSNPADPTPTIGGPTLHSTLEQGPYDQTYLDGRDDIYTFETNELTQNVTATGRIKLTLYVSADQADCDVAVRLVDEYPDGTNMLITDGIRRMRFRNGYTVTDEALMVSGEVYEVQIELPFTNYTWLTGHRIKIYLSGNNSIRWNVNLQNGGTMYTSGTGNIANITVHHNDTYHSRITIPGDNQFLGITGELTATDAITVYPNPANETIWIQYSGGSLNYMIFDLSGKLVDEGNVNQNSIDVTKLENGIYVLQLRDAEGNLTEKKLTIQ